ncbi:MAG: adenylate/guanylate cyclase domain-containing protein [Chloroflexi bacterium]|nr:adenylate/guanylate cyclase domain-containing protein [Chloroflexota bacterium]
MLSDVVLNGTISLGGERREVTMLVVRIREFESLVARSELERLADLVNSYLGVGVECVTERHGVVQTFHEGRGLTAVFGAPVGSQGHAVDAVRCGLEIRARVSKVQQQHADVGIASGLCFAGNIGSQLRMEYAVMGPATVRAEQLAVLAASFEGGLLVSAATAEAVGSQFPFEEITPDAFAPA